MRYAHTNLIAKDWQKLSHFYQSVFGCIPDGAGRNLSGRWIEQLTGLKDVRIEGEHLRLPGYDENGPTLEIFSYSSAVSQQNEINGYGFSHIAFEVKDVDSTVEILQNHGGSLLGAVVKQDYGPMGTGTFVYAKDPEGNIVEIQSWA